MWMKKWEGPYPGTSKMDRRVEGNLKVVKKFVDLGVPKKQICQVILVEAGQR